MSHYSASSGHAVSDKRNSLFREGAAARMRRYVLALAYAVHPKRIHHLPRLAALSAEWRLQPAKARSRLISSGSDIAPNELVAVADDLSVEMLVAAFRRGVYPMAHIGPMKWWSPDIRAVMNPEHTYVDQATRRIFRQKKWSVTFDRDFAGVLHGCAAPRAGHAPLTWLTSRMAQAFESLHDAGYAHSVEVWDENGDLAGGLFGVAIGGVYFGQSMFTKQRNASKVAIAALHRHLAHWGYTVRDGRETTVHLQSLGFSSMPRAELQSLIAQHIDRDLNAPWTFDATLDMANWGARSS